jgi:hypothetical protein
VKATMRPQYLLFISATLIPLAAGCTNLPTPHYMTDGEGEKPAFTVADLTRHVRCEIQRSPRLAELSLNGYVAQVTMTLKVDDNGGITPNMGFLDPGVNFTHLIDANFNLDRQQIFTTAYSLDTGELVKDITERNKPAGTNTCTGDGAQGKFNLTGDLGIDRIIDTGLPNSVERNFNIMTAPEKPDDGKNVDVKVIVDPTKPPSQAPNVEVHVDGKQVVPPGPPQPVPANPIHSFPTFGSTVQFTLVKTFDTGPTWKLTGFTGPSGSKGLFNGGRTNTDTIVVAFAPPPKPPKQPTNALLFLNQFLLLNRLMSSNLPPTSGEADKALQDVARGQQEIDTGSSQADKSAAAAAAQSFTTNVILQNLTNALH